MGIQRRTVASATGFSGIGVFSGRESIVSLIPSPEPSGIIFATGGRRIALNPGDVLELPNRTAIESDGIRVEVIEHLLACLHGSGITDLTIESSNGEIPLIDGSALPMWNAIETAGITEIKGEIEPLAVEEPVYVEANEAVLIALPYDGFRISYFLAYDDPRIGSEHAVLEITPETFGKEIAPARSFIEYEEAMKLVDAGVVKSDDASQVLIVYPDGVHGEFRVEKEFTKHKMLDLIGDLYLTGRPVRGHFIGLRSGHGLNRRMLFKLAGM